MSAARALSGYRRLFRARKVLFRGDEKALRESRVAIRTEFDKHHSVPPGPHLEGLLTMIDEAEDMLLNGIVQGALNPASGNYEVKIQAAHVEAEDGKVPNLEPITAETSGTTTPKVEVTKSDKRL